MRSLSKENRYYLWGFKDKSIKPDFLSVYYDIDGWYGGRHVVYVTISTTKGEVVIAFASSDIWGYVNPLGECTLNGEKIKTSSLIGDHKYRRSNCNMISIVEKLINI